MRVLMMFELLPLYSPGRVFPGGRCLAVFRPLVPDGIIRRRSTVGKPSRAPRSAILAR
jgi:hypothetical protein